MKSNLIIIGNGGHAREVVAVLREMDSFNLIGFTALKIEKSIHPDVPILGDDSILPTLITQGVKHAFIAVGDNRLRAQLYKKVKQIGFQLVNIISPRTYFLSESEVGDNVFMMPGALISANTHVGSNIILGAQSYIGHDVCVEDHVHLASHVSLSGNAHIEMGVLMGNGSRVIPHKRVGKWSIVGAGATVTTDIPAYHTAVGVPAKSIKIDLAQELI